MSARWVFSIRSAALAAAAACSSFSGETAPAARDDGGTTDTDGGPVVPNDGSSPDGAVSDAEVPRVDVTDDGGACDYTQPFGTPAPIVATTAFDEREATLFGDQLILAMGAPNQPLKLAFSVQNDGGGFTTFDPVGLPGNAANGSRSPTLSPNGKILHFLARNATSDTLMWRLSRNGTGTFAFTGATGPVNTNNKLISLFTTSTALWYSQNPGSGDQVLRSPLDEAGASTSGFGVGELDGNRYVVATGSENRVFYASKSAGVGAKGGYDVWTSSRDSDASPFGDPKPVPELSSEFDDFPSWISADGCRILIFRTTSEAGVDHDIYFARRPRAL